MPNSKNMTDQFPIACSRLSISGGDRRKTRSGDVFLLYTPCKREGLARFTRKHYAYGASRLPTVQSKRDREIKRTGRDLLFLYQIPLVARPLYVPAEKLEQASFPLIDKAETNALTTNTSQCLRHDKQSRTILVFTLSRLTQYQVSLLFRFRKSIIPS